jgi:hypothetical protein
MTMAPEAKVIPSRIADLRRESLYLGLLLGVVISTIVTGVLVGTVVETAVRQSLPLHCSWPADSVVYRAPR